MAKTISILDSLKTNGATQETVTPKEIVENQLKDLMDEAIIETLAGANPEETITSIHKSYIERRSLSNFFTGEYRLSNFIQKLPHGILDKKATGIGATTLELKARRNSIIVVPTKKLAYNKHLWAEQNLGKGSTLYIGSPIPQAYNTKIHNEDIARYIESDNIKPKKLLVVADSLKRLVSLIGDSVYKEYFLMVDEIDIFQADSNYRDSLEDVIDYYFKFNIKNRSIVSATMGDFSNPLFEDECRFTLDELTNKIRTIKLIHTKSINYAVSEEIKKYPEDKILIAYNSVQEIRNIIHLLETELQSECAILCSDTNKSSIISREGEKVLELKEDFSLPKRITFMTCCYFSGIDINDTYHLIAVSNGNIAFQALSTNKITQIYGRCRLENGILSDTIIYNTHHITESEQYIPIEYRDSLLNKANKVLELYKSADKIAHRDQDIIDLFKIVKNAIKEKAQEKIERGTPVELTRKNIEGKYVPAYLNIDFLVERHFLFYYLYSKPSQLKTALEKLGHNVNIDNSFVDNRSEKEKKIERTLVIESKDSHRYAKDIEINETIEEIKSNLRNYTSEVFEGYLKTKITKGSKNVKTFLQWYSLLYKYIESDKLLDYLYDIRHKNTKAFNNLNNTIMFWCLAEDHPLRISMREAFETGKEYTPEEIHEKIEPIIKYHFHKTIKPRTSISLFKAYFEASRPRNSYVVIKENPLNFEERKSSIGKKENNLLEYFLIN